MLRDMLQRGWLLRYQFIKYFIIGSSAFILDITSLFVLKEYAQISAVLAVMINQLFIANYVFFLNKYWSFKAQGITHHQMIKFGTLAIGNYFFSIAWMWLFNHHLEIYYLYTRIGNVVLAVGWNFFLYKYWIYNQQLLDGDKLV